MKIRQGFVSNSSSSSFTCDVCGEECSGMDIGLEEAEMMECVNGHCFCDSHMGKKIDESEIEKMRKFLLATTDNEGEVKEIKSWNDDTIYEQAEEDGYFDDERYEISADICPICNFTNYHDYEACRYLMKKIGLSKETMLADMKKEFPDYKKLQEFIRENKDEN